MARTDTLPHFLTDVADAIRTKGGTSETIQASSFDTAIANLPSGSTEVEEKDVNFYDYDGTRVYSYTKTEFLALESMPENPTHDGLTSQGWNWEFQDAIDFVTNNDYLDIGQMYETTDGKLHLYLDLVEGRTSIALTFGLTATDDGQDGRTMVTATVEWGDGTSDTVTGNTKEGTPINHNYASGGQYLIKIATDGYIYMCGGTSNRLKETLIKGTDIGDTSEPDIYSLALKKIELSSNTFFYGSYVFTKTGLESITMANIKPCSRNSSFDYLFSYCRQLRFVVIPKKYNELANINFTGAFNYCSAFEKFVLPANCNIFGNYVFDNSQLKGKVIYTGTDISNLASFPSNKVDVTKIVFPNITYLRQGFFAGLSKVLSIKLPKALTSIPTTCFYNCLSMKYYDFSEHEAVPTLSNTNAFTGIPSDCKIIVPDDLYEDWIAANNWSTYSSYIIKKTDWDNL